MTRMKKKVPSVAGHKFVPIKREKRDTADQEEYKAHKRKNQAKKKRHASTYEKTKQEQLSAQSSATATGQAANKRPSRLKHSPAEVEQASKAILEAESEDKPAS